MATMETKANEILVLSVLGTKASKATVDTVVALLSSPREKSLWIALAKRKNG